jgi:aspartate-semialdehyde dehydrogenase
MKIAVVGATGLVGQAMLKVLEERKIQMDVLIPVASERSVGKKIVFGNREVEVVSMEDAIKQKPQIALFSAGGATSKTWAEKFAEVGTFVIDNSSAWRMFDHIPLIVPEINGHILKTTDKIIANPNCSTIELVLALAPLHWKYKIRRMVVSTYQSVTGTGVKGIVQLKNERDGISGEMAYPHPIDLNVIPHGGVFEDDGYTSEEVKLVNESRKILGDQTLQITATVVRVPVYGGHSESVNVEFLNDFDLIEVRKLLSEMPGVVVQDEPARNVYPMPKYAEGKDEVFVGRIRRDFSQPKTLNFWVVSDNLRKGAATNAVQIAEYLISKNLL